MPNSQTSLNTTYFVNDSAAIVTIGLAISAPGQTSSSIISLGDVVITDPPLIGDVNKPLKKNNELDGVVMRITTLVTDTSRQSNHTGVEVSLTGGTSAKVYPLHEEVVNEGESVTYSILIRFKQLVTI